MGTNRHSMTYQCAPPVPLVRSASPAEFLIIIPEDQQTLRLHHLFSADPAPNRLASQPRRGEI